MIADFKLKNAIQHPSRGLRIACICALLVALVFVIFGKTVHYGFVYDDELYISGNPVVQKGLTMHGILWSFTFGEIGHWHPLTWMSHMLDCQIYGLKAGGHHLTNVLLHAAAVVLLFLVLFDMTGALWRCAFVAAAWSIHPLRVESVAWIAERKDVLSGVFFMLALGAYVRYARRPSVSRYILVAALFALGLLCKDMLVTVPCVLLLLDYWPLGRLKERAQFAPLLKEKIPLFALSAASCAITFLVPEQVTAAHRLPPGIRIENALVSWCIYLRQSVWPFGLSANYPNPAHAFPLWEVAGAIMLLCFISVAAFRLRKSRPFLLMGWLWFAGMLVPVIGLVQISHYAHADRYTYLPQIGLWIAVVWMAPDVAAHRRDRTRLMGALAAVILCVLSAISWRQVTYWRDSISLWTHAFDCNQDDAVAHNNLGFDLLGHGDVDGALRHLRESLRLDPSFETTHRNLGIALEQAGRLDDAIDEYREALRLNPDYTLAHEKLALALQQQGKMKEAIAEFREEVRSDPGYAQAYNNLGNALSGAGDTEEAVASFRDALKIDPGYAEAHNNLGDALVIQKKLDEAVDEYREAIRLKPGYANAHYNLGNALLREGQGPEAIRELEKAVELQSGNAIYENDLALVLSTGPVSSMRNGPKALELARDATSQSAGGNNPMYLRTLAAAYAETGDFPNAVTTARKAIQLVQAQPNAALAAELQRELKLYEAGRTFERGR